MAGYPLSKFHFKVIWNGEVDQDLRFTEVSGLTKEIELIEYRDGFSSETSSIKMPGREKFSNVTLKRGTFKGNDSFYKWYDTISLNEVERRDVDILMLDQNHEPVVQWTLKNAWCMKIEGTDLKADGNEVAIESMEVVHEGLTVDFK
ncbi:MAG: phage tail protein [Bacteroidota bacterium]